MIVLKSSIFLIIFIFYIQYSNTAKKYEPPPKFLVRPKSIHSQSDNKTVLIKYCYLKAYSRIIVTANLGLKFLVPVTKPLYIQLIFKYRYGTIFRQIIGTKQTEWCGVMEGADTNPLVKIIISAIPQFYHKCPYEGELDLFNVSYTNFFPTESNMFPEGTYRINAYIFKSNITILRLDLDFEIKSPRKESFG